MTAAPDSRVEELVDNFALFDDWEDRFRYLIDLGRRLAPMDPALKTEESKVRGCTSQVWIVDRVEPGVATGSPATLHFIADSDAPLVTGLIAVLLSLYDGRPPPECLTATITNAITPHRRSAAAHRGKADG